MVIHRNEDGSLQVVQEGDEQQMVYRDCLKRMVRDHNMEVVRVAIWKQKYEQERARRMELEEQLGLAQANPEDA